MGKNIDLSSAELAVIRSQQKIAPSHVHPNREARIYTGFRDASTKNVSLGCAPARTSLGFQLVVLGPAVWAGFLLTCQKGMAFCFLLKEELCKPSFLQKVP